jgi:NADPH:quinone reductase
MASNTSTQKALIFTTVGQPLELVHDRAVPEPGPNQVQLKVTVAGLNPHDHLARDFGYFANKPGAAGLPMVLANDVVGVVTKLGPGVTAYAVGDRIVSQADMSAPAWNQSGCMLIIIPGSVNNSSSH